MAHPVASPSARRAIVLGAGMIGTCTALHLQQRGFDVALVDRREPGQETSCGNAGLIQREAVEPYPFPRQWDKVLQAALGQGVDVHYHAAALARAERCARELIELGHAVEASPWLGARPCTPDMLPVMGPAPRHPGLWFNFGHAHQGFTLGPVAGRLLAELIAGEPPFVDPDPYRPGRFAG